MSENIKINVKNNNENSNSNGNIINNYQFNRNTLLSSMKRSQIKIKALKLLKEIEKKKESNSIFLTEEKKPGNDLKAIKVRKKRVSLINSNTDRGVKSIEDFNVFGTEDKFIKELMEQFNKKNEKKLSKTDKKQNALNKLYGIDPYFSKRMNIARRNKKLPLEEYQANTFKILTKNNIGKTELNDLAYNLKHLRMQSDSVSPLPPINLNIIYDHVYKSNSNRNKKINKMSIKQLINESNEPKDEFEKEEKLIKKMMSYKAVQRGKRNKAFDILPEYLKSALSKRFKKNI